MYIYIYIYICVLYYIIIVPIIIISSSSSSTRALCEGHTPSPPIKSLDFRRFDSSRLLILRGGNSHVR